jgi:peptide/nickel transport system permease protein
VTHGGTGSENADVLTFLARRIVLGLCVLWAGTFLSFSFFASVYLPLKTEPLLPAYWRWLRGVPTGHSFEHGLLGPLWPVVRPALVHTLVLLGFTMAIVIVFSVTIGCLAARWRGSGLDLLLRGGSSIAWAVPPFILALVLEETLGGGAGRAGLGWFPPGGWAGQCPGGIGIDLHTFRCPAAGSGAVYVGNVLWYLTLPAVALAVGFIGLHSRYLRVALGTALEMPYIAVARAKGLPERQVLLRHALRNSLIVFVPALLGDFGAIFGASLVIDVLFRLNGVGGLFISLLNLNSEVPVLDTYTAQLLLLIGGALVVLASLLGELAIGLIDPRVGFD